MKKEQKETPNSPKNGGLGVEVSKTLFYWIVNALINRDWLIEFLCVKMMIA